MLQPIAEELGDAEAEDETGEEVENRRHDHEWKVVAGKVEDLTKRMAEYMDDEHAREMQAPPMIPAPQQPTKEEYERHQITHLPCAP